MWGWALLAWLGLAVAGVSLFSFGLIRFEMRPKPQKSAQIIAFTKNKLNR